MSESSEWYLDQATGGVHVSKRNLSDGIAMFTTGVGQALDRQQLVELDAQDPLFTQDVHPIVAELLSGELRYQLGRAEALDVQPDILHLGRLATWIRLALRDWDRRAPIWTENLWVADDYDLIVDRATGVIMRLACRADGEEFSVREMTEAVFDEPIHPSVFEPPG